MECDGGQGATSDRVVPEASLMRWHLSKDLNGKYKAYYCPVWLQQREGRAVGNDIRSYFCLAVTAMGTLISLEQII